VKKETARGDIFSVASGGDAVFRAEYFPGIVFTVQTAQVAIVQRLGKFARVAGPGLNWKTPFWRRWCSG
jgi:hypothetical protein